MLPPGVRVIVRDWLNANHVLLEDDDAVVLIDSGHLEGRERTLALLGAALRGRQLRLLVNTHSHSDHMGGNAAVRRAYGCPIAVPAGEADRIERWDERALWLDFAGQQAERFAFDMRIEPGSRWGWGTLAWEAICAPGHADGALMFHCPSHRILISGDALWEHGLGVILADPPDNIAAARDTLDRIADLDPHVVIPGHGGVFTCVSEAVAHSRARLDALERDPLRLARSVMKTMLSFTLLTGEAIHLDLLPAWLQRIEIYRDYNLRFLQLDERTLADMLVNELVRSKAARIERGMLIAP